MGVGVGVGIDWVRGMEWESGWIGSGVGRGVAMGLWLGEGVGMGMGVGVVSGGWDRGGFRYRVWVGLGVVRVGQGRAS